MQSLPPQVSDLSRFSACKFKATVFSCHLIFYSYLQGFIRNIRSQFMTDIFELQFQQPCENNRKKPHFVGFYSKNTLLLIGAAEGSVEGISTLPPM